ncbi:unnamed protein product, partial [Allacma fusca]
MTSKGIERVDPLPVKIIYESKNSGLTSIKNESLGKLQENKFCIGPKRSGTSLEVIPKQEGRVEGRSEPIPELNPSSNKRYNFRIRKSMPVNDSFVDDVTEEDPTEDEEYQPG